MAEKSFSFFFMPTQQKAVSAVRQQVRLLNDTSDSLSGRSQKYNKDGLELKCPQSIVVSFVKCEFVLFGCLRQIQLH